MWVKSKSITERGFQTWVCVSPNTQSKDCGERACLDTHEPIICHFGDIFLGIVEISTIIPIPGRMAVSINDDFARPCSSSA